MLLNKKIKKALREAALDRFIANPRKAMKVTSEELIEVNRLLKPFPKASFLTLKLYATDDIEFSIRNNELGFQLWRDDSVNKWLLQISNAQLKSAAWKKKHQKVYRPIGSKELILLSFDDDSLDSYIKMLNTTLVAI